MKKIIASALVAVLLSGCGIVENVSTVPGTEKVSSTETSESTAEVTSEKSTEIPPETVSASSAVQQTDIHTSETVNQTAPVQDNFYSETYPASAYTAETAPAPVVTTTQTVRVPVNTVMSDAELHLSKMTLHQKVCQMFITVPEAINGYDTATYVDCAFHGAYAEYPVGGIVFFAKNIENSEQTSIMITDMQNDALFAGTGLFMAVDEEGGTVTRVQSKLGTQAVYDMNYYGNLNDWNTAFSVGETIGSYLAEYGFNLDFAPVADVNISPCNELGSRIFSTDPQIVADMSGAVADGLQSQGVCATLKHFPGLGAGNSNTHYNSVWIDRTFGQLAETEFTAFRGGIEAGADFVMVGHQIVSASGDNLPSDLSHVVVTEWLRGELGFNGIAVTDSHSMGAISNVYTSGESAVMAVEAGIDMILMPANLAEAVAEVEQAVESGRITEERINESVLRILEKKDELGLI